MNIEKYKNLQIKCICNSFLDPNVFNDSAYYYCIQSNCRYFKKKFNQCIVGIQYNKIEINLFYNVFYYYGIISSNFPSYYIKDNDLVISFDEAIKILKLFDVNKYIEKYESLVLFK
jgi:hypothetical protein